MKAFLVLFLGILLMDAHGQYKAEEFQPTLLHAKYGAMLVYNGTTNSFAVRFMFKSFEPTSTENIFRCDNSLIQVNTIPFTEKVNFDGLDEASQKEFLSSWRIYEQEWTEDQLKSKINGKVEFLKIAGRLFLYWSFNMPASNDPDQVLMQVHLVTACFDQMLVLNGPVEKNQAEIDARNKLVRVANTLNVHKGKVQDINKLYHELMN